MKTFIAHISKSPLTKLCRLFFLLSTAVAITACTGKNNVIDITPENSLEWMSVYQLERSDTATLLKGNVYGQPGEQVRIPADMFLKDRATGTEYRLKGSPDFKTGENVEMPEGITLPFTLAFEPLQKNATLLDLVCGKESIRGIHTTAPKSRYVTTITGTFHGRPNAARLVLLPAEADFRTTPYISIPVKDGKFCYKLHTDIATAYDLIAWDELLSRGWYTTTLFSDGGTTEVEYYPTEEDKAPQVVRTTSKAGKELGHYKEKVMELTQEERLRSLSDSLWSNDLFYSEQYKQLLNEAQKQNTQEAWEKFYSFRDTDEALSAEGKAFKEMSDSLHNIQRQYTTAYSREKQDIVGFYLIFREYFW